MGALHHRESRHEDMLWFGPLLTCHWPCLAPRQVCTRRTGATTVRTLCRAWPRPYGLAQHLMGYCEPGRLATVAGPRAKFHRALR
jgi:hypothetical protein